MSQKLRDVIRRVRACKTAAEERAVIAKESALIRTAFKDQDKHYRHRNVAKLLFIHMLGYPSHFGQMECVKLIASSKYIEKRMGYLGLIVLLSDHEDVLTLVTNSMKNDLNSSNPFVVSLSLTAIGNIASPDMARDLVSDIDRHLRGENQYLRKKAALAAIRVFEKIPEVIEDFTDSIKLLVKSKNHGVLLTGVQLLAQVVKLDPKQLDLIRDVVDILVRLLRSLLIMGYSSDYDVNGITDPFLQVAILDLFCLLGKHNEEASEAMNDVLTQVATNTESAKTAGNAILYECVQTIMAIKSDSGLKVLAVNILGRFLLNRDNNIRYVALNTLSKVVVDDAAAVQRHTNTIVECLKDPDASIRQRALELVYALVNDNNIQTLAREMLNYLVIAPNDHKHALCSRIADAVDRYAPSMRWHIDTIITMLSIAGSNLPDERICNSLILLIQRTSELHQYVAHKLFWALNDDISQLSLVHVGVWCIGEYGHLLLSAFTSSEVEKKTVCEKEITRLFQDLLRHYNTTDVTRAYILNACAKLTTRCKEDEQIETLRAMIKMFSESIVVELQQRSSEYTALCNQKWVNLRVDILASMPPVDMSKIRDQNARLETIGTADDAKDEMVELLEDNALLVSPRKKSGPTFDLLDLDDIFSGSSKANPPTEPHTIAAPASDSVDLLDNIFAASASDLNPKPSVAVSTPAQNSPHPSTTQPSSNDLLGGLLDLVDPQSEESVQTNTPPSSTPQEVPNPAPTPYIRGYEKNGIIMDIAIMKPNPVDPSITFIKAIFSSTNTFPIEQFALLAAFPKYINLKLEPPSGNVLPPNSNNAIQQIIKIQNTMHGEKPVAMRIKLAYLANGTKVEDMATITAIPSDL